MLFRTCAVSLLTFIFYVKSNFIQLRPVVDLNVDLTQISVCIVISVLSQASASTVLSTLDMADDSPSAACFARSTKSGLLLQIFITLKIKKR